MRSIRKDIDPNYGAGIGDCLGAYFVMRAGPFARFDRSAERIVGRRAVADVRRWCSITGGGRVPPATIRAAYLAAVGALREAAGWRMMS